MELLCLKLVIFFVLVTISCQIEKVTSAIVDEAGYNIQSVQSELLLTAVPPEFNQEIANVITQEDLGFARNQKWGVKYYGNDRILTPGDNKQNNVSVEWLPSFSRYVAITYDLDGVCQDGVISERNQIYQIHNKKTGLCLTENNGMVVPDECKGTKASWRFIRVG